MHTNKNIVPLSGGFMLTAIVGGIISALYVFPRNASWGVAFCVFFAIMFVSSMVSMTYSPIEDHLKMPEVKRRAKKK